MATENTKSRRRPGAATTTENTTAPAGRRRGPAAIALSAPYIEVLDGYAAALRTAPLSEQTRRTYASKVRQFLAWLAAADLDEDPLILAAEPDGTDLPTRWIQATAGGRTARAPRADS